MDEDCQLCGEGSDDMFDPLAHFKDPAKPGEYVMAHGQCGEDAGLELA
jgi:hypothetical protein